MNLGRQIIKFGLVGVLNTAIHYIVFLVLLRVAGAPLLLASAIGYVLASVNSFLVNRRWTFQVTGGGHVSQYVRFMAVYVVALGLNLVSLQFLVVVLHMRPEIAQALAIGASLGVNFAGNRWWVFRIGAAGS